MSQFTTPAAIRHAEQIVKAYIEDRPDDLPPLLHEADRPVVVGLMLLATSSIRLLAEGEDASEVLTAISEAAADAVRDLDEGETEHE